MQNQMSIKQDALSAIHFLYYDRYLFKILLLFLIILLPFRLRQRFPTHLPLVACGDWSFKCGVSNIYKTSNQESINSSIFKNLDKDASNVKFSISFCVNHLHDSVLF